MKTWLIPAAFAIMLAGSLPAARADVTLFGPVDSSIGSLAAGGGSEDLGNGLKAIFSFYDFPYDTVSADPGGSFTDRGPPSDLPDAAGENPEGRADNTIRYDSSDWKGLRAGASYTLDGAVSGGDDNAPYGIGARYANGGFLAVGGYEVNNGNRNDPHGAWKVGSRYALGKFAIYGQFEDASIDNRVEAVDYDLMVWRLGASAHLGNTMAYFAYGQGGFDFSGGPPDEYTSWTLALTHNLGKHTLLYTGFSGVACDVRVADTVCGQVGPSGGTDDKFALGMKHRF